jgi:amidase
MTHELIKKSAVEVVDLLRLRDVSVQDTLDALVQQIESVDDDINALPTLCLDRPNRDAGTNTILAGLPVAIKDLTDVAGVRTTSGSLAFENVIPEVSDLMVTNLETNGASIYAKSNTPEFGSGGQTFNEVFGVTRNPFDKTKTAGGSSGGAAAALATGCAWLANGSDLAGSLRTPASFCGVTSLRPSPGLINGSPGNTPFEVYSQQGPMARNIPDLALFADAMTNVIDGCGLAKRVDSKTFRTAAAQPLKPSRIAFSSDLGISELSKPIATVFDGVIESLEREGLALEDSQPDLKRCDAAFDIPRGLNYAQAFGPDLEQIRSLIKPENIWNIEYGLQLSMDEILDSRNAQAEVFNNASQFMQQYDLLICPATIVEPFDAGERYPGFSDGVAYSEYYRWIRIAYAITATTLPVITVPIGKTQSGLPVGIQLIGKPHGEEALFRYASYLEQVFDWNQYQCF